MNSKSMFKVIFWGFLWTGIWSQALYAGPFAPPAGQPGSDAVPRTDSRIVGWATLVEEYLPGSDVSEQFQDTTQALGPAEGNSFQICSLGNGGSITVSFGRPVPNGVGPDLAVFENSFDDFFLELAFVEVSSDGVNFFRFPNRSLTPPTGGIDATDITGLASKYRQGFGTPFDLADLPDSPLLNKGAVTHVRLLDIVSGTEVDSEGGVIYDPTFGINSAGVDCDAIALLESPPIEIVSTEVVAGALRLQWVTEVGVEYQVVEIDNLGERGSEFATVLADEAVEEISIPLVPGEARFFRIEVGG